MHWGLFGAGVGAALFVATFVVARRGWNPVALTVAFGNWMVASFNAAAPFRGAVDPDYVGYAFGLLSAERGLSVSALSGAILLGASASAVFAARQSRGPAMAFVAAFDAVVLAVAAAPGVLAALQFPGAFTIQFGEYLTLPPAVAVPMFVGLIALPFALGVGWSARRIRV
ncbi:MAG: hypothetical protein PVI23_00325 [Maricaulaceae bacterium]|jgi:hypothetical protein